MNKFKKMFKKSIVLPVMVAVLMIMGTTGALAATGVVHMVPVKQPTPVVITNPKPVTDGIKLDANNKTSAANQAIIDSNSEIVRVQHNANGTTTTIARSAANGPQGPDEDGCWPMTMQGGNIPAETRKVCTGHDNTGDAYDGVAFSADWQRRSAAASQPVVTITPITTEQATE